MDGQRLSASPGPGGWRYHGQQRPPFAVAPGPGEESAWDYPRPPRLERLDREVVVKAGVLEIARTRRALRVLETASPPTVYIPRADMATAYLQPAPGGSYCEWKGMARYWTVATPSLRLESVGWSYDDPRPAFEHIRECVSFYPGRIACYVDGVRVQAQPGGFYGGWITPEVVGPFKGGRVRSVGRAVAHDPAVGGLMTSGSGIDPGTPPGGAGVTAGFDRNAMLDWYRRNRARSAGLFDMLAERVYVTRPIALRNPVVFYEGHLPGFSVNTLIKKGLGRPGVNARLEDIFARGIDPEDEALASPRGGVSAWPDRREVRQFADACDQLIEHALLHDEVDRPGVPVLDRAEGVFTLLEHEAMHQETLLYMWHQVPHGDKRRPEGYAPDTAGDPPVESSVTIPPGTATLGAHRHAARFGWDNEFDAHEAMVPAFEIDAHIVTNAAFLEFVEAGGYEDPRWWGAEDFAWARRSGVRHPHFWERDANQWYWRGQFDRLPLPLAWPVYVSHAEASAFARWRGKRLPTEAEFHRAAYGTPDGTQRAYPWGDDSPDATRGHFGCAGWDPVPAGSRPAGASAWGVHDLVGNGWEWTSTVFAPFQGFRPMPSYPEYSAEFFDGQHFVLKGASPATAHELLRPSFRNWFRPHYPYVYASFRCARSLP